MHGIRDEPRTLREYLLREAERWEREANAWEAEGTSDMADEYRENASRLRADAEAARDRVVVKPKCSRCVEPVESDLQTDIPLKLMFLRAARLPKWHRGVGNDDNHATEVLQHHLNLERRGLPWLT